MELLKDFISTVKNNKLGVYGIHIYQNGKVLANYRFRSNDRENLCSASKTFVSIGVGIAENEGLIQLTDRVLDYFPEYKGVATPDSEKITIYHLLLMSSGHSSEDFSQYNTRDRAELFFMMPVDNEPGSTFFYEDLCSYMLGRIIEKVSGATLLAYLKTRLFDKLGIVNPQWHTCQLGHTACSGGLYLTTEEFSRLGIMLLQNGMYHNRQVVSSDYVNRMYSNWIDTTSKNHPETQGGYGLQVWKCTPENTYRADGMYGQMCVVLIDYNAVITVTAHNEEDHKDILLAIWDDVLVKLEKYETVIDDRYNCICEILFKLELKLLQPDIRCSEKEISELLDIDFVEFCRSGRIWQYRPGDVIDTQVEDVPRYGIADYKIKELSKDSFLATYRSKREKVSGEILSSLRSSIWKKNDGKWKMIFHQGTPVPFFIPLTLSETLKCLRN